MPGHTIDVDGSGRHFALLHPYPLTGHETSHPLDARGWTTSNLSLLVEDDHALLVGTGYSVHQDAILAQLDELVGDRPIAIVVPRAEFAAMCNARPIADRFRMDMAWLRIPSPPHLFLNFRPQFSDDPARDGLRDVPYELIERGHRLPVDLAGRRVLEILSPELRLLPNSWAYDEATRTLLSSDIFTWVTRATAEGPWLIGPGDPDPSTPALVEHALADNRYWWIPGADMDEIRASLAELFETYEIDTVVPEHGPVLRGREVIERQVALLDAYLARAAAQPAQGVAAASWKATATEASA